MAKWSSEYETVDIEADDATLGSDWTVPEDTKASNGRYVSIKPGLNSTNAALSKRENVITIPFSVSQDAKNYIDARANFPSADDDSFWMKTDEGDYMPADGTRTVGWDWVQLSTRQLKSGEHTLTFAYREDEALLDRICVTTYAFGPSELPSTVNSVVETGTAK